MLKVFRKLLPILCILLSQIGFSAESVDLPKAESAPKTENSNDEGTKLKNFLSPGKGHIYVGMILTNTASDEAKVDNTTISVTDDYKLKSPAFSFGFDYLPVVINDFQIGAGFMYETQREISSYTQKIGSAAAVSYSTATTKIKVSTLSALVGRELVPSFSVIAGLNLNFVTISGNTSSDYETSGNMGFQVAGAYTYNNFRTQLMYKNVSGDVKGTGKGSNTGTNVTGTYDYNHFVLTVGLMF
jgi:hypothetical protein